MNEFFTSQTGVLDGLSHLWTAGMLVFVRCIAFTAMAPLVGHKSIPVIVKIGFAMSLTLLILPNLDVPVKIAHNHYFVYVIIMNVLVGMMLGWMASLVIEIARAGGEMINMQMALHAANLFDPGSQTQTTILGKFFDMMAITLFVTVGGVEKLIEAIHSSYNVFPIFVETINFNIESTMSATANVIALGFLLISPIMMILLTLDLILGLMSRAAPQINAFQISFSIKPSVGLILLLLMFPAFIPIIVSFFKEPMRFMH